MNSTLRAACAEAVAGLAGTLAMNIAQRLWTIGYHLTDRQRAIAAPIVHFSFGAGVGGVYGVLVER